MDKQKLKPQAEAIPEHLVCRLAFDLTRLPPSSTQFQLGQKPKISEAEYQKLVDHLLADSAFG
jgi:hypothetical protein